MVPSYKYEYKYKCLRFYNIYKKRKTNFFFQLNLNFFIIIWEHQDNN